MPMSDGCKKLCFGQPIEAEMERWKGVCCWFKPLDWVQIERKQHNKERTFEEHKKLVEGIMKRDQKRRKRIEDAGIDYECPEVEEGNKYVKMGKKHYSDAIDCYTSAINQKALSDSENSVIFANRARVNLQLGNYRRALLDVEEAYYRDVKASLSLKVLVEAESYCQKGLEQFPDNEELNKLAKQIYLQKSEYELREAQISRVVAAAKYC